MFSALSVLLALVVIGPGASPDPPEELTSPGDGLGLGINRPAPVPLSPPMAPRIPAPAAGLAGLAAVAGLAAARPRGGGRRDDQHFDGDLSAILGIRPGEEILLLEPGHDGRIAVRIGPADADHVAVFVPGTGADLMSTSANLERARNLHEAASLAADGESVAVIYALPFDAPDEVVDLDDPFGPDSASTSHKARVGSAALTEFVAGLELDDADVTVIGHSYGSTVVGHALAEDRLAEHIDRVVFVGSPGVGVSRAGDLNLDEVYAMQSDGDLINNVPPLETTLLLPFLGLLTPPAAVLFARVSDNLTHGVDPTAARFGATVLDSGDFGHGEYFDSLENVQPIADVVAGKTP